MITLDKYTPRPYQIPFFEAMEDPKSPYRATIIIHPRRSGKDYMAFHYSVRHALRKTTSVLYFLSTYSQCKSVIWNAINSEGVRFLDTIPPEVVKSFNASEMRIEFNNGSMIHFRSAENWNKSAVGAGASLLIFSEFGTYDNDLCYLFSAPIISESRGKVVFISTPRGRNHFWHLWQKAQKWPDWYCELLTVDDTKHIIPEQMEALRREHSEEHIQQEFYCSFDRGIEGSYYSNCITKAIKEERIRDVPYDQSLPVHTAWDLGYNNTVIIFFQVTNNNNIHIIDFEPQINRSLRDWIKIVKEKDYVFGKHFGPHDTEQHEYSSGMTRIEFARSLGLHFETREVNGKLNSAVPRVSVEDGIEKVMATFNRIHIDQKKCAYLINAMETYHKEWDPDLKTYKKNAVSDWSTHTADAFRYMCLAADMTKPGMTAEDARKGYQEAMYTNQTNHPFPFDQGNNNNWGYFR